MLEISDMSANLMQFQNQSGQAVASADQSAVKSKEYYVKVPKNKKRFHALKFHTTNVDLGSWSKVMHLLDFCFNNS